MPETGEIFGIYLQYFLRSWRCGDDPEVNSVSDAAEGLSLFPAPLWALPVSPAPGTHLRVLASAGDLCTNTRTCICNIKQLFSLESS